MAKDPKNDSKKDPQVKNIILKIYISMLFLNRKKETL